MGRAMSGRRSRLRERDGDACFYCGRVMLFEATWRKTGSRPFRVHPANEATVEHLLDRQHGGSNDMTNLVLACKGCNSGRNYMTLPEKLASRFAAIIDTEQPGILRQQNGPNPSVPAGGVG